MKALVNSWSTKTVTWNNVNTTHYAASVVNQSPPTYAGQLYNLNVAGTVQNWASGAWNNNGFLLISKDYYSFPYAISSDAYISGSQRPRLIVTYR